MTSLRYQLLFMKDLSTEVLYDILQIRQEVFVVEQKCFYLDADGVDLDAYHFVGRNKRDVIVAYLRIIPADTVNNFVRIGRVLVRSDHRGQGLAREIMAEALNRISAIYPDKNVKVSAQTHLEGFYASLGFVKISQPYDEDGIEHVDMVREAGSAQGKQVLEVEAGGCLSAELLKNFAERSCSETEKQRCVEHIRECKTCYGTYMTLMMAGLKDEEQRGKGRVIYLMNYPVNLNALVIALLLVAAGFAALFLL